MSPWPKGAMAFSKSIIVSWNKADIVRRRRLVDGMGGIGGVGWNELVRWDGMD